MEPTHRPCSHARHVLSPCHRSICPGRVNNLAGLGAGLPVYRDRIAVTVVPSNPKDRQLASWIERHLLDSSTAFRVPLDGYLANWPPETLFLSIHKRIHHEIPSTCKVQAPWPPMKQPRCRRQIPLLHPIRPARLTMIRIKMISDRARTAQNPRTLAAIYRVDEPKYMVIPRVVGKSHRSIVAIKSAPIQKTVYFFTIRRNSNIKNRPQRNRTFPPFRRGNKTRFHRV